jgi:hypothetical protein
VCSPRYKTSARLLRCTGERRRRRERENAPDEDGKTLHELPLGDGGIEGEEVVEESSSGEEFVGVVRLDEGEESGVEGVAVRCYSSSVSFKTEREGGKKNKEIREEGEERDARLLNLVSLLTQEQNAVVDQLAHDETEQLSKVESRNHFLKRLLSRLVRGLVDDGVVRGTGEVLLLRLRVERAPVHSRRC